VASSFSFSKILPSNSIINPNIESFDYLDVQSPFTFFDFLKYTNTEGSPQQINELYLDYLRQWNVTKGQITTVNETIKDRYVELIKEITLKYTTSDEKRFLSNIDFNDPLDLDIVLPFYSKKISEVCNFYAQKREKIKHKVEKNKIKGTSTSLERALFETITDIVFSDALEIGLYQKNVDYSSLLKNLNIETEELYDLYTNYLDNDPDESYETYDVKTELRQQLYSSNLNRISANLFLNMDSAIAEQILEDVIVFLNTTRTTLNESGDPFPFVINYNIDDININCKPDDKLFNLVNETKPKATRIAELRYSLIKKYIGSDFYYITTGDTTTDVVSGVLFKADNPSGNLLNRNFPTTATVEEESDLKSLRRIGLFFTPEKNSILYFSVPEKKYLIDETKLESNKLYIFPDPNLYGNTIGLKRTFNNEYPLIHIADYTKSVKNYSNYAIEGDINSTPATQDYYSYFSKSQTSDKKTGIDGLTTNFSSLYNVGVITQWSTDIYGNQFSLFKEKKRKNLVDKTLMVELSNIICEKYDGGPLTYKENGLLPEEVLTGHPNWVKPNIWASNYYYNLLIEGGVGGIENGLMERGIYFEGYSIDGLVIDRNQLTTELFDIDLNPIINVEDYITIDGLLYTDTDPLSFAWDINYVSGFNTAITYNADGKFFVRVPGNLNALPQYTLDGTPTGNISEFKPSFNNQYVLSSVKYKDFDAGTFSDYCGDIYDFEIQTNHIINQISLSSLTLTADNDVREDINSFDLKYNYGKLKVKDILTGNVVDLSAALYEQLESKYESFKDELTNNVVDFNIYNDFIWIRTINHLVFEKLEYYQGKYVFSGTTENYINYTNYNYTINVSNPFIFENRDYCMAVSLSVLSSISNNFSIVPTFYKINYKDCSMEEILNTESLLSYKNNTALNPIKVKKINKPTICYNTRNNKYAVVCTVEDINEMNYVYKIIFEYDGMKISNQEIKFYAYLNGQKIQTINFYDNPTLSGLLNNNAGQITFNQISGEMILS
jgi:hypothetical protein